jgi:hypothetical protein
MLRLTRSDCVCVAFSTALMAVSLAMAQPLKPPADPEIKVREKVKVPNERSVRTEVEGPVVHEHFVPHRSTEMVGMHVQSARGTDVGTVKDLVLDCASGQVRYVVVAFAFEGYGDKLFALPWGVFDCKAGVGSHEHVFIADITQEQVAKAPSFTASAWPDFTEVRWVERNETYYRDHFKVRTPQGGRNVADADVNRDGVRIRTDGNPQPKAIGKDSDLDPRKDKDAAPRPDKDSPKSSKKPVPKTNDKDDDTAPTPVKPDKDDKEAKDDSTPKNKPPE